MMLFSGIKMSRPLVEYNNNGVYFEEQVLPLSVLVVKSFGIKEAPQRGACLFWDTSAQA